MRVAKKNNKKLTPDFHYKNKTYQEMVDQLNEDFPVDLRDNEQLVDRIYARYPLLQKSEVSLIVKAVFASFRDLLVLGKMLNFNSLFNAQLLFFRRKKIADPVLRVQVSTPDKLKKDK